MGMVFFPSDRLAQLPPPIQVRVNESVRTLTPETTLGRVRRAFDLEPKPGSLVDVEGVRLVRGKYPGTITVNGVSVDDAFELDDGDRVEVRAGKDRTEPLAKVVIPVTAGTAANPQFHLGTTPGKQIITKGKRSGKVVSSVFRPAGDTKQPLEVALTFDDGPSPVYTPRILNVLARHGARATFFPVGFLVDRYPEIVRREVAMGMAVGNHSQNHPYASPFAKLPMRKIRIEIGAASRQLADVGVEPRLFRPPGGSWSNNLVEIARKMEHRTVLWSVDSRDWTGIGTRRIVKGVLRDARPGSIVLLHDGGGNRSATVRALPAIIKGLRAKGLQLVTL